MKFNVGIYLVKNGGRDSIYLKLPSYICDGFNYAKIKNINSDGVVLELKKRGTKNKILTRNNVRGYVSCSEVKKHIPYSVIKNRKTKWIGEDERFEDGALIINISRL